jgi:hypothetical protein
LGDLQVEIAIEAEGREEAKEDDLLQMMTNGNQVTPVEVFDGCPLLMR